MTIYIQSEKVRFSRKNQNDFAVRISFHVGNFWSFKYRYMMICIIINLTNIGAMRAEPPIQVHECLRRMAIKKDNFYFA